MADWIELIALNDVSSRVSTNDVMTALSQASASEALVDEERLDDVDKDEIVDSVWEKLEPISDAAFAELERRSSACGGGSQYPYAVDSSGLRALDDARESTYVFLAILARIGPGDTATSKLFEELCAVAAEGYFGSGCYFDTFELGYPRRQSPASFREALDALGQKSNERFQAKITPKLSDMKDAGADLALWVGFPDGRRGMFFALGNCASGHDWDEKLNEVNLRTWDVVWLKDPWLVPPVRLFFTPAHVSERDWDSRVASAGVFFDRFRITASTAKIGNELATKLSEWTGSKLGRTVGER